MDKLNKKEILRKIADHSISSKEGLRLLKTFQENQDLKTSDLVYIQNLWKEAKPLGAEQATEDSDKILIVFDRTGEFVTTSLPETGQYQEVMVVTEEKSRYQNAQYQIGFGEYENFEAVLKEHKNCDVLYCWEKEEMKEISCLYQLCRAMMKIHYKAPVHFLIAAKHQTEEEKIYFEALESFLKTIHMENPKIWCRLADVGREAEEKNIFRILCEELRDIDKEQIFVRYDSHGRMAHTLEEAEFTKEASELPFIQNGCYMITGGLGGLGYKFAGYLAKNYKADLILLGRSQLEEKGREKIAFLEQHGIRVRYFSVDVCNEEAVGHLFELAKKDFGKISGILHCAGIIKDRMIASKPLEEFLEVIKVKVKGTLALYKAMKAFDSDLLVLFSSITAALGNVGQCDYAYGNGFENALADYHLMNAKSGKVAAIGWPLWEKGGMMVAEPIRDMMKKKFGLNLLCDKDGFTAFEAVLRSGFSQITVFDGEREKILLKTGAQKNNKAVQKVTNTKKRKMEPEELERKVDDYLKQVIHEVTSIAYEDIGIYESFEMYGMDSITAMKMNDILEENFGELSKTLLFEHQCIHDFSLYFIENYYDELLHLFHMEEEEPAANEEIQEKSSQPVVTEELTAKKVAAEPCEAKQKTEKQGIAIIGVAGRYPKADNIEEFWENLMNGVDCIEEIPKSRWDYSEYYDKEKGKMGKVNSKWGGFLSQVDKFDPLFFNISPREANVMDPQERIFLETTWSALEDAGYYRESISDQRVGVFAGVMNGHYQMIPAAVKGKKLAHSSVLASVANRVSYHLNLNGPSIALDTMCSSSMSAIHLACNSIEKGESDMAIAGGVMVMVHPDKYLYLGQGGFLSSEGKCRAFGEGGDGYVPSEGAGVVILKPLDKAVRDKDNIYGVIKGHAMNHGGKTSGYTVPNPKAQTEVIQAALMESGLDASRISYVETHGTGTSLGDPIEVTGLVNALDGKREGKEDRTCMIGSVKSNIGHTEAAAGVASLTKVLLQMKYKKLVPSIHSSVLNKNIDFDKTIFQVEQKAEPWKPQIKTENGKEKELPRCAGISCFGAGGTNGHLIVEEFPYEAMEELPGKCFVPLSAKNEERLMAYVEKLRQFVRKSENDFTVRLSDIAYTLQAGREVMKTRAAFIVKSKTDLIEKLTQFLKDTRENSEIYYYDSPTVENSDSFLLDGAEGENFVNAIIQANKIEKLAKLWVRGYKLNFEEIYRNIPHRKISLPTYPFLEERCWLPQEFLAEQYMGGVKKLHPLVHENVSDFHGVKFCSSFVMDSEEGSSLKWDKNQMFSPFAVMQMLYEASNLVCKETACGLEQIAFGNPEFLSENKLELITKVYPAAEGTSCEVIDQNARILIQGKVNYSDTADGDDFDLEAQMQKMKQNATIDEMEAKLHEMGLEGNKLKESLLEYRETEHTILSKVNSEGGQGKRLDKNLYDMVLLLCNQFISDKKIYAVYEIEKIRIFGDITKESFLYIEKMEETDGRITFSVRILNDSKKSIQVIDRIIFKECPESSTSGFTAFQ